MITDDQVEQLVERMDTLTTQMERLVSAMSAPKIERSLTVADVAELTGRSRNSVMDAANAGALASLPREKDRGTHRFLPKHVQEWINAGTPLAPHKPGRRGGAR